MLLVFRFLKAVVVSVRFSTCQIACRVNFGATLLPIVIGVAKLIVMSFTRNRIANRYLLSFFFLMLTSPTASPRIFRRTRSSSSFLFWHATLPGLFPKEKRNPKGESFSVPLFTGHPSDELSKEFRVCRFHPRVRTILVLKRFYSNDGVREGDIFMGVHRNCERPLRDGQE